MHGPERDGNLTILDEKLNVSYLSVKTAELTHKLPNHLFTYQKPDRFRMLVLFLASFLVNIITATTVQPLQDMEIVNYDYDGRTYDYVDNEYSDDPVVGSNRGKYNGIPGNPGIPGVDGMDGKDGSDGSPKVGKI